MIRYISGGTKKRRIAERRKTPKSKPESNRRKSKKRGSTSAHCVGGLTRMNTRWNSQPWTAGEGGDDKCVAQTAPPGGSEYVDNSEQAIISLCAGAGGLDLGVRLAMPSSRRCPAAG